MQGTATSTAGRCSSDVITTIRWAPLVDNKVHCACRRNELVALDLIIGAIMAMFAFVSMVGGILGTYKHD